MRRQQSLAFSCTQRGRLAGYDATETRDDGVAKIQIKGRCILNPMKIAGRMGGIDLRQPFDVGNRPAMSSTQPRKAKTSCALKFK